MTETGALIMMAFVVTGAAYIVRVITNAVLRHKEIDARSEAPAGLVSDARMARLEVAVESIALEVERISEGQRFTTKLLNDAAQRTAPRLEWQKKQDTPH